MPYYKDASYQPSALEQYYRPVVSMIAAPGNCITSSWYSCQSATDSGGDAEAVIGGVLGNVSNLAAVLTTWWLNDSMADLPLAVKLVIDGVGAGVLCAVEA